jgi:hypothetical protein
MSSERVTFNESRRKYSLKPVALVDITETLAFFSFWAVLGIELRQVLYHLSHPPVLLLSVCFSHRVLLTFAQAGLEL